MQDPTAERRGAPIGDEHTNGWAHDAEQSTGEEPAISEAPEPAASPRQPASSVWLGCTIEQINIANHYGCHSKSTCGIMESEPREGEEEAEMEIASDSTQSAAGTGTRRPTYITLSHAAALSEKHWGEGRGRSSQTIRMQLKKIAHIQSERPPNGGFRSILLELDSFLQFDQATPPREDRTGRQAHT